MASPPLIPSTWKLPDELIARLGTKAGRQRLIKHGLQVLLVLHDAPKPDENDRRGVLFWRDDAGQWKGSNGIAGPTGLAKHLDEYAKKLDAFDLLEAQAETANDYLPLLDGLAPIVRSARNQLQVFEDARREVPEDRSLIDHRDRAYELSRMAELLYDDAKNRMEVAIVKRAEEQAHAAHHMLNASHRLNVMVACFFPFATLGAIFGTTLTDNWSWSQTEVPFAIFIIASCIAGGILAWFVTRPAK